MQKCDCTAEVALAMVASPNSTRIGDLKNAKNILFASQDGKDADVKKFVKVMELWVRGSIERMFETERKFFLMIMVATAAN